MVVAHTVTEARKLAQEYLDTKFGERNGLDVFPDPDDFEWCFLFEWNTKRYYETKDVAYAMGPGSGPIVVIKSTGEAWMMTSSPSFNQQIEEYRRDLMICDRPNAKNSRGSHSASIGPLGPQGPQIKGALPDSECV